MPRPTSIADARASFTDPYLYSSSPLYRALATFAADSPELLDLACRGRPGQHPALLFLGVVHHVLRRGADHELAQFYPSLVERPRPAVDAGPVLLAFCRDHREQVLAEITSRLVQTSHVQRSLALRLGLWRVGRDVSRPLHLIEVGASVGLNLRFDRYGCEVGGRSFGDPASPVQIRATWHGAAPVPDLDALPIVASRLGVDLNPIDATDPAARRWLESLVWPENVDQLDLLDRALAVVAADPPTIRTGDIVDVALDLASELPRGEPRVVFHCATRSHVPEEGRPAFDAAVESLGETGPMHRIFLEEGYDGAGHQGPGPALGGVALTMTNPSGRSTVLAVCEGHLRRVEPLDLDPTVHRGSPT